MGLLEFGFLSVVDKLQSASSAHAWWVTLEESVFYVNSSIPPLWDVGGALVSDPLKVELLSEHFDSKQSRDSVALPLSCHPESKFCTFAFRFREVERILLDLDMHSEVDPLCFFLCYFLSWLRFLLLS